MYKLLAKQPNTNVWVQLETLTTDLPINKQRNDIAELKDRQGDYSQAISLPMIAKNCDFFGYINSFTAVSDLRRRKYDCRLFFDGIEIAGAGSYLKIIRITDYFEVQILGAESAFIKSLNDSEKTINDLGLTEALMRSASAIYNSNPANDVFFGISDFQLDLNSIASFDRNTETLYAKTLFPFVNFKLILDRILFENGNYSLVSNVTDQKEYLNSCIPLAKMNPLDFGLVDSLFYFNGQTVDFTTQLRKDLFYWTVDGFWTIPPDVNNPADEYMCDYNVRFPGKYTFQLYINLTTVEYLGNPTAFKISIDDIEVFKVESTENLSIQTLLVNEYLTLDLTAESVVKFEIYNNLIVSRSYIVNGIQIKLTAFETESDNTEFSYGYIIPVKGNLPVIKQSDFFKFFLQMFGLTISIDDKSKTIYAHSFKKVIDNKSIAKDWTSKHNTVTNNISHQIGEYCQENVIKYATENVGDRDFTDSSKFLIADEMIKEKITLIEFIFESVENYDFKTNKYCKIKWLNGSKIEGTINPKLCIVSDTTVQIGYLKDDTHDYITPELFVIGTKNVTDGIDITAQGLQDKYYGDLISKCLQDIRFIEDVEFLLDAIDIQEYDPFVPIYLQQYSSYFYINKIKNFIAGKLTKVDLIKI